MPHHRDSRVGGNRQHADAERDNNYQETIENYNPNVTYCCVPAGCCANNEPIQLDELYDVLKVICNNEQCQEGTYMHRICFEAWEQSVLTYLRSTGRARSWSEKQRLQNLWTKKGYDLAFKACGCKCGKGHLKKDLDFIPRKASATDEANKKKKNRKKKNDKPSLGSSAISAAVPVQLQREGRPVMPLRVRTNSLSSSGSGSSPPHSSSAESPSSPTHSVCGSTGTRRRNPKFFSDWVGNGSIFFKRIDYSSFNSLPAGKINGYHIKMEDDGNHGNDDTRCFVLSSLAANNATKTSCVLCHSNLHIYDKYPLIDGTFFLSPRQHSKSAIPVKVDGRGQFLCAVCMGCLEGWNTRICCRYCRSRWDGSHLILGSMYSYDIFAAVPCCHERLRCNCCHRPCVLPSEQQQRLLFFSDYSRSSPCPSCGQLDFHFVKSLSTFLRSPRNDRV